MIFLGGSRRRLLARGIVPAELGRLLRRVEDFFPHLGFNPWVSRADEQETPWSTVGWLGTDRQKIRVALGGFSGAAVESECYRRTAAVALADRQLLDHVLAEAKTELDQLAAGRLSLVEFGTTSIANSLRESLGLHFDPLPLLRFIRALSGETYENQRVSYGLVINRSVAPGEAFSSALDNKRFKNISDGFTTALHVGINGQIRGLLPLVTPDSETQLLPRRPWWSAGLAEAALRRNGIAIGLTKNGDLVVLQEGQLCFTQRGNLWRKWDHNAILAELKRGWCWRGNPQNLSTVLNQLYHVALDLAFRRCGGLLVVVASEEKLRHSLLPSSADRISSSRRKGPEVSIDASIAGRLVQNTDRRVLADLASMDGALVVDRVGHIKAWGAMTRTGGGTQQGARARAAMASSRHGLAVKISSDGDISFFSDGEEYFKI